MPRKAVNFVPDETIEFTLYELETGTAENPIPYKIHGKYAGLEHNLKLKNAIRQAFGNRQKKIERSNKADRNDALLELEDEVVLRFYADLVVVDDNDTDNDGNPLPYNPDNFREVVLPSLPKRVRLEMRDYFSDPENFYDKILTREDGEEMGKSLPRK